MKTEMAEKDIVKRALALLHGGGSGVMGIESPAQIEVVTEEYPGGNPVGAWGFDEQPISPHSLAATILADNQIEEVKQILVACDKLMGIRLDSDKEVDRRSCR